MDKTKLKHNLLLLLQGQRFADFYTGEFEKYIRVDYEVGTRDHADNLCRVDKALDRMAEQLLKEN